MIDSSLTIKARGMGVLVGVGGSVGGWMVSEGTEVSPSGPGVIPAGGTKGVGVVWHAANKQVRMTIEFKVQERNR